MAVLLALLSSLLWGVADFTGGTASRRLPALLVVMVSQAAGLVAVSAVAAGIGAWSAPSAYLPWAVAAGLVGAIGLFAFYHALAVGTMGVVSPIAALGVIVPVAVGLATGHWPSPVVGAGIVVAVLGVVGASGPERRAGGTLAPVLLAVVGAIGFGAALLFIARGAESSPVMTMVVMRVASVAALMVVAGATGQRRRATARRLPRAQRRRGAGPAAPQSDSDIRGDHTGDDAGATTTAPSAGGRVWLVVVATGILDVSANLVFALASTGAALAVVAILGSLYPAVTVLLARVVHGERLNRLQQGGVVLALIGVALIAGWS